jgi:hypothetical protein
VEALLDSPFWTLKRCFTLAQLPVPLCIFAAALGPLKREIHVTDELNDIAQSVNDVEALTKRKRKELRFECLVAVSGVEDLPAPIIRTEGR